MSEGTVKHDIRLSVEDGSLNDMSDSEEAPTAEQMKAPIEINSRINLFAIYEKRRKDFMARHMSALAIVKMLQVEYWTGISDKDIKNLYGWAKEDSLRLRGIKPYPLPTVRNRQEEAT